MVCLIPGRSSWLLAQKSVPCIRKYKTTKSRDYDLLNDWGGQIYRPMRREEYYRLC